jgi:hypothetical protein
VEKYLCVIRMWILLVSQNEGDCTSIVAILKKENCSCRHARVTAGPLVWKASISVSRHRELLIAWVRTRSERMTRGECVSSVELAEPFAVNKTNKCKI